MYITGVAPSLCKSRRQYKIFDQGTIRDALGLYVGWLYENLARLVGNYVRVRYMTVELVDIWQTDCVESA